MSLQCTIRSHFPVCLTNVQLNVTQCEVRKSVDSGPLLPVNQGGSSSPPPPDDPMLS